MKKNDVFTSVFTGRTYKILLVGVVHVLLEDLNTHKIQAYPIDNVRMSMGKTVEQKPLLCIN